MYQHSVVKSGFSSTFCVPSIIQLLLFVLTVKLESREHVGGEQFPGEKCWLPEYGDGIGVLLLLYLPVPRSASYNKLSISLCNRSLRCSFFILLNLAATPEEKISTSSFLSSIFFSDMLHDCKGF